VNAAKGLNECYGDFATVNPADETLPVDAGSSGAEDKKGRSSEPLTARSLSSWNGSKDGLMRPARFVCICNTETRAHHQEPVTSYETRSEPAPRRKFTHRYSFLIFLLLCAEFGPVSAIGQSMQFVQVQTVTPSIIPAYPLTGDMNGDGKPDLVIVSNLPNGGVSQAYVFLGRGDGTFNPGPGSPEQDSISQPGWPALADLRGDNKLDLIVPVADYDGNPMVVSVLLGNGDGALQPLVGYPLGTYAETGVAVGDFTGNGKLDLAVAESQDVSGYQSNVSVLLGNGDGTFGSTISTQLPGPAGLTNAIVSGDFNRDGKLDVAVAMQSGIYVLLGNGDGTFQAPVSYGGGGDSLVAADFNGDGILDLAASGSRGTEVSVFLGNGDGTFQLPVNFDLGSDGYQVVAADMNGDGKLDLVVGTADGFSVWLGNGDGTFSLAVAVPVQENGEPTTLAVADFNNDGRPDVAVVESTGNPFTGNLEIFLQGPLGVLSVAPPALNFAPQAPGTNSSPQAVTLTNSGTATLALSSIGIDGTDATGFSETNNCPAALAANASCQIKVISVPNAAGSQTALLSIADNAPGSPQTVVLTGTGQDFSLTASPTTTTVTPGQAGNYTLTVSPLNGFSQKVALSCSGAPPLSTCMISPSSVTLNGSANATASVAVVTAGSSAHLLHPPFPMQVNRFALWIALPGLVLLVGSTRSHSRKERVQWLRTLILLGVMSLVTIWPACGGGNSGSGSSGGGTPPGTYTVTVTGTFTAGSVTLTHATKLTLVVQ